MPDLASTRRLSFYQDHDHSRSLPTLALVIIRARTILIQNMHAVPSSLTLEYASFLLILIIYCHYQK